MKQLASVVGALALAIMLIVGRPSGASAHSEYDHSDPADGATVATAPTSVKVAFTEELQLSGSSLRVNNAAGQQIDNKDTRLDPSDKDRKTMIVTLPASLPAGTYKVLWKSISADDGDADDGDFSFTVRGAAASAAASPVAAAPVASPAAAAAAQATPAAKPAGQPSPTPIPAQAPRALPNTGTADPGGWMIGWVSLGAMFVLGGIMLLRRSRAS